MRMRTGELARAIGGRLVGPDVEVDGASIDSRNLVAGQLFVPIVDERDGHDYIAAAVERGAPAYVTSQPGFGYDRERPDAVSAIVVGYTDRALEAAGRWARQCLETATPGAHVVGVTGSVGKTTTKDLLAAVLATTMATSASVRSFNNELGVPLTLANAPDETQALVVEMGARGIGHIAELCAIAVPTVGVVTTVESVHTELFGDLADVARAKGELIEALPSSGVAVLNVDNPLVAAMADRTSARVMRVGSTGGAEQVDVFASDVVVDDELRASFTLHGPSGSTAVHLNVRGRHNVMNALLAAATGLALGVDLARVADGLGEADSSPWRMELSTAPSGARVLNDAYNAGPASMAAALSALAEIDASRRVALVGVMAELGSDGPSAHRDASALARSLDIDVIAIDAPDYGPTAVHVADVDAALAQLRADGPLGAGDAVLVKGSRVAGLERLAAALTDPAMADPDAS